MGIGVKKYVQGNDAPWTIADGVMVYFSNMRSMSFPKTSMDGAYPCPDTYKGEFWLNTEDERDHGGVHINSGVQNKWFYLLTDGDSGTNDNDYSYQVEGIGIEKSQQIAYRTLTEYATRESQYADIRLASLQAAEDLYGANSVEVEAVGEAWSAVGVDENQTGIEMVNGQSSMVNGQSIYNLAGQRLNKMQKGINIVNGKKILK
jgi:Zn-dependent metalloprotease